MIRVERDEFIRKWDFAHVPQLRIVPVSKANSLCQRRHIEQDIPVNGRRNHRGHVAIDSVDQVAQRAGNRAVHASKQRLGGWSEGLHDTDGVAVGLNAVAQGLKVAERAPHSCRSSVRIPECKLQRQRAVIERKQNCIGMGAIDGGIGCQCLLCDLIVRGLNDFKRNAVARGARHQRWNNQVDGPIAQDREAKRDEWVERTAGGPCLRNCAGNFCELIEIQAVRRETLQFPSKRTARVGRGVQRPHTRGEISRGGGQPLKFRIQRIHRHRSSLKQFAIQSSQIPIRRELRSLSPGR